MHRTMTPEHAGAIVQAQGVAISPQGAADAAQFANLVLERSATPFSALAFEDEPSGFLAAKLRHAP